MTFGDITTLTGRSGAQYQFGIHPRQTRFIAKGAVFAIGRAEADNRYGLCYIGQTGDLSVRPFVKDKESCFNAFGADHVLLLDEQNPTRRAEIAADLVAAYTPSCNTI